MSAVREHEEVLKAIETAVVAIWRRHREMTNYAAGRAYEAAVTYYHGLAREQTPKPHNLKGLEAELFDSIKAVCDACLEQYPGPKSSSPPIPVEDLVSCLRRLSKSVDFWTKRGGRQGYMEFIEGYLP